MPREKMPVWEYDPSNGYAFIQKYESISEVQEKYYNGKYPMFRYHPKIHILPNENIITTQPIYQLTEKWVNKQIRVMNYQFKVNPNVKSESVEVLNENGDVIAWFYKPYFIDKLKDKISAGSANNSIHKNTKKITNGTGIYYRKSNKTFTNNAND